MDYRLFEASPGIRVLMLPDAPKFTVLTVSDDFVRTTGRSREEMKGSSLFDEFPANPEDESFAGLIQLVVSLQEVVDQKAQQTLPVYRYDLPDSTGGFIEKFWRARNVPWIEDGEVKFIIHAVDDISPEVRASRQEERIRALEKAYDLLMQAPVAVCIVRDEGHIVELANRHMLQLIGRTPDIVGKPLEDTLTEARDQGLLAILDGVRKSGNPYRVHTFPAEILIDGVRVKRYFDLVFQPYFDDPNSDYPSRIFNVAHDITQQIEARKMVEESDASLQQRVQERTRELESKNQELQRSNANLEEFAYAASHDLKEPIRKIHFFAARLKDELHGQLSDSQQRYFDRMEHAAARMNSLIEDLLEYSHVSRGTPSKERIDLNEKLRRVLEDLEIEVAQRKARVTVGQLPLIQGHRRQIQQVFQNLIGNALKYQKAGTAPEISIHSQEVKGSVVQEQAPSVDPRATYFWITVRDNGIGFDPAYAQRIFNVFTRLHGQSEYSGTGVGLSIVQKVMQNHGGFIWAESRPGEGSAFHLLFPATG